MSHEPPSDARAQALAAVLRPILRQARELAPQPGTAPCPRPMGRSLAPPSGADGDAERQLPQGFAETAGWRGAVGILPAVLTLADLQRVIVPWDGLIHRAYSQQLLAVASDQPRSGPSGAAASSTGAPAPTPGVIALTSGSPTVSTIKRSGWELIRTQSTTQVLGSTWLVRHELARRLGTAAHAATATAVAAPARPPREALQRGVLQLCLRRDDVEAWALSSGDRNALHLRSGAAAQAGLDMGGQSVIAHGLLLGALSLALVPGDGGPAGHLRRRAAPRALGTTDHGAAGARDALSPDLLPETGRAGQATAWGEPGGAVRAADVGQAPSHVLRFRFPAPLEVPPEEGAPLLMDLRGSCVDSKNYLVFARA